MSGAEVRAVLEGYRDGYTTTAPVASLSTNELGFYHLGGNAAEWMHDVYASVPATGLERDPLGPREGRLHVIRGASWRRGVVTQLRLSYRDFGDEARDDVGIRLARYAQ